MTSPRESTSPLHDHRDDEQSAGGPWVPRFGRTERFAHWWTMAMVATALLTGLVMGDDGGSGPIVWMHAGSVALIGVGIAAALTFGDRRALLRSTRRLFGVNRRDTRWLRDRLRHPADRHQEPAWGMFNPGQKLLAWALSISVAVVVVTSIVAWSAHTGEGSLHGNAVVLTALLLGAHLFMAIVNPATRPALTGMAFGRVRRSWAAEHHRAWLNDLEQSAHSPR
jgi:formate dehydrogenase subunit gamma